MGKDYSQMINEISEVVEIMEETFDNDICDLTTSDLYSMATKLVILRNSDSEVKPTEISVTNGDVNKQILGNNIKNIRLEMGLTLEQFGELFNPTTSKSIVSRWERGVASPNASRLKTISELSNVSVDELLGGM